MFKEYGFETFVLDICYFINRDKDIFLYLYIDDIIVIAPTNTLIIQTKKEFVGVFEMKELSEFYRYFGCRIDRNQEERFIYIFQGDFIIRSLKKYGYNDLHPILSPWLTNIQIPKIWNLIENTDTKRYMFEVVILNFVETIIRPDI